MKNYLVLLAVVCQAHKVQQSNSEELESETDQNVDSLIDKYEEKEETESAPQPVSDLMLESEEETGDYQSVLFQKYSEVVQGDDGMPTSQKLISKANARSMAEEVLKKEKTLSADETKAYLKQNFNRIWKEQFKKSENIDENQVKQFMSLLL